VPEIADYEVRRELLRARKTRGLERLDLIRKTLGYLPLTTNMMLKAAELWTQARNQGTPTADRKALDCDVISAAQALSEKASSPPKTSDIFPYLSKQKIGGIFYLLLKIQAPISAAKSTGRLPMSRRLSAHRRAKPRKAETRQLWSVLRRARGTLHNCPGFCLWRKPIWPKSEKATSITSGIG